MCMWKINLKLWRKDGKLNRILHSSICDSVGHLLHVCVCPPESTLHSCFSLFSYFSAYVFYFYSWTFTGNKDTKLFLSLLFGEPKLSEMIQIQNVLSNRISDKNANITLKIFSKRDIWKRFYIQNNQNQHIYDQPMQN